MTLPEHCVLAPLPPEQWQAILDPVIKDMQGRPLDIIAIHSLYVMLGVIINSWGLELDEFIANPLK